MFKTLPEQLIRLSNIKDECIIAKLICHMFTNGQPVYAKVWGHWQPATFYCYSEGTNGVIVLQDQNEFITVRVNYIRDTDPKHAHEAEPERDCKRRR